ncbi:acyltransferase [Aureimonas pseudogalii]|uniref:Acetyltransferase-like isoleucine patch superfamily enzyme n=1 Tax=Aureimonas pseudogalii TaxID=1744844 RepID=A0A7W6EBC9_9HYPH|nr:acyltransferase [Aureimonas pseudogalii]MBB3998182.1 acetyltransferase-like isoleucine patch superfamily enzyme [Aureimonas pseudogalii]
MLRGLVWRLSTFVACARLRRAGAQLGRNLRFYGLPIASGDLRRLRLGDNVAMINRPEGTALGVRAPTILRILGPDGRIDIGADTGISGGVVCSAAGVTIGRRCLIGADVMIFDTDFHNTAAEGRRYAAPDWPAISRPVVIEDDVFVGTGSKVMKGTHIGRGSIIGAGSLVTGVIPPFSIAVGNPARVVRSIEPGASAAAMPSPEDVADLG